MVSLYYSLSFAASIISSVAAHGAVTGLTISGKTFKASEVNRSKQGQNPLHKNDGNTLICNVGASSTTKSQATANPGDKITFNWVWTKDQHPGPIDTYLAYCGASASSCNNFGVTGNVWFKIQEAGALKDSNDFNGGFWASDKLKQDGNKWTITLPQGLKKGAYVMRHSIIAMHLTKNPEFYPFCTHLVVGGSATGAPSSSQLVSIPGIFSTAASKKALDFNIFAKYKTTAFTPSGPRPITSFGSGSGSGPAPASSAVASTTKVTKTVTVKKASKTQGVVPPTETEDLPECPEDPEYPVDPTPDPTSESPAPTGSATPTSDLPECPASTEAPEDPEDPEDPEAGDPEYKRDLSAGFNAGVKAVRQVIKRMNTKHGKRRITEWH